MAHGFHFEIKQMQHGPLTRFHDVVIRTWYMLLTYWGRVTQICVGKLITIGSDNGLSPDWRQAIIWTNAVLLSIGPLRTYFSEN